MAGERSLEGAAAGAATGAGVPGLLGLLLSRRRGRATRVLVEGACPACLALGLRGRLG
jgi:hypothetical protein